MTASLLGIIAQHGVIAAPPRTVVTPQRMGDRAISKMAGGSGGTLTATLPNSPPTAGNLLLAQVQNVGNNTTATVSTPTGWNAGPHLAATTGSQRMSQWLFYKWADGTETSPSFTIGVNTLGVGVVIEEWAGLDSAGSVVSGTGVQQTNASGTPYTITDTIITARDNDWVWSGFSTQQPTDSVTGGIPPWAAPQVQFSGHSLTAQLSPGEVSIGSGVYATAGTQHPSVGPITPPGTSVTTLLSLGFKTAAGTRPGVSESAWGSGGTTTTFTATLRTTPDPSDLLLFALLGQSNGPGTALPGTVSGCGASWAPVIVNDPSGGGTVVVLWVGTNPLSAGTVTLTTTGTMGNGHVRLLRVAGTSPTVTASQSVGTGTSVTGPSVTGGPGQVVVAMQNASVAPSSDVLPEASLTPAARNWSRDAYAAAALTSQCAWTAPASAGTSHTATATSNSSHTWSTVMAVCG